MNEGIQKAPSLRELSAVRLTEGVSDCAVAPPSPPTAVPPPS